MLKLFELLFDIEFIIFILLLSFEENSDIFCDK